jgi:hypothetical protein
MALTRRATWIGLALLLAGCQSLLNADKSYRLDAGSSQSFEIDPPRYEQKVALTIETDAPVTVHVFLKKDVDAVEKDLTIKQKSDKTIATWSGDGKGTLDATIPAHEIALVRIETTTVKPANVKVHVQGK